MRRIIAACVLAAALAMPPAASAIGRSSTDPADLAAGEWVLDKPHASVFARVLHMGYSNYTIRFNRFDAAFSYDPKAPQAAKVTATVDPASVDTGTAEYDGGFAGRFLDAGKGAPMTFTSTTITAQGNRGTMAGDLTLRGVTRPVTFDVTFNGTGGGLNPLQKRAGFSARTVIKRSDFGSTFLLSTGIVGDEVEIVIEAEFIRK